MSLNASPISKKTFMPDIEKNFYVRSNETVSCPVCNGKLLVVGSRTRKLIREDDDNVTLNIRRLQCHSCGKIHHELPDCIVPYKRYSAEIIVEAVTTDTLRSTFSGETSTLIRLRVWFKLLLDYVSRLREHFLLLYKINISNIAIDTIGGLKRIVRILVNSSFWAQTRLAMTVRT